MFCLKFQGVQVRFAKKKLKFSLISEQISMLLKVAFHSCRNETLLIRCGHFASSSQELPVQAQSFTLSRHLTSPLRSSKEKVVRRPLRSALNLRRCEQPVYCSLLSLNLGGCERSPMPVYCALTRSVGLEVLAL